LMFSIPTDMRTTSAGMCCSSAGIEACESKHGISTTDEHPPNETVILKSLSVDTMASDTFTFPVSKERSTPAPLACRWGNSHFDARSSYFFVLGSDRRTLPGTCEDRVSFPVQGFATA
jgi:hypothetical protein